MRVLGIDLAWAEGSTTRAANETGVVAVDETGSILEAGWTVGIDETAAWMTANAAPDTLAMVDAPLVVDTPSGMRACERQVGQRYGRWKISANSTNLGSRHLGGVTLREALESVGWRCDSGLLGPPTTGRVLSECYPYTTLVGASELGFGQERPRYKRTPRGMPITEFRPLRADACDRVIAALAGLVDADPSLRLSSHSATAALLSSRSPRSDREYKHREDLIDAVICAWTGLLWLRFGLARCQVLGEAREGRAGPTIIAPARPEQRG